MSAADKIAEANGPERIWAHGNCMGRLGRPLLPGVSSHWATWETRTGDPNHATEYVRADLADAQAQEIERLRKVLGFYANPENWKGDEEAWERAENGDDDPETLEALLSTVELDGGKIARAALGETP